MPFGATRVHAIHKARGGPRASHHRGSRKVEAYTDSRAPKETPHSSSLQDCLQRITEAEAALHFVRVTLELLPAESLPPQRDANDFASEQQDVIARSNTACLKADVQAVGQAEDVDTAIFNASLSEAAREEDAQQADDTAICDDQRPSRSVQDGDSHLALSEDLTDNARTGASRASRASSVFPGEVDLFEGSVKAFEVKDFLKRELDEAEACLALPAALVMFLAFLASVLLHMRVDQLYGVERTIVGDIVENMNFAFIGAQPFEEGRFGNKNFYDINCYQDFWSWLDLGLSPILWMEGWGISETRANTASMCSSPRAGLEAAGWGQEFAWMAPHDANWAGNDSEGWACPENNGPSPPSDFFAEGRTQGTYLNYNVVVGGVRLSQDRQPSVSCMNPEVGLATTACTSDAGHWLPPEVGVGLSSDEDLVDQVGGETQFLLAGLPRTDIRAALRQLENEVWFGPHTSKIEVAFITYNPHIDMVSMTFVWIYINRGGDFTKSIHPFNIWLSPYHSAWCYLADVIFAGLVVKTFIEEGLEVLKAVRTFGPIHGLLAYGGFWNMIDWMTIFWFAIMLACWVQHLLDLQQVRAMLGTAQASTPGHFESLADLEDFFDLMHSVAEWSNDFRMILAIFPFVVVARFFKAFSSQPRLAMVTNTLRKAGSDIFHFGVIFVSMFTIYVTSALILFGQEVEDYSTFLRATNSVFRLMLGDYDWDEVTATGRMRATIWFWSFMWLVNFIMLNMQLAIIMDVYTEVRTSIAADAETVWSQTHEVFVRWRNVRRGTALPLRFILNKLDPEAEHTRSSTRRSRAVSRIEPQAGNDGLSSFALGMKKVEKAVDDFDDLTVVLFVQSVPGMNPNQASDILKHVQHKVDHRASLVFDDSESCGDEGDPAGEDMQRNSMMSSQMAVVENGCMHLQKDVAILLGLQKQVHGSISVCVERLMELLQNQRHEKLQPSSGKDTDAGGGLLEDATGGHLELPSKSLGVTQMLDGGTGGHSNEADILQSVGETGELASQPGAASLLSDDPGGSTQSAPGRWSSSVLLARAQLAEQQGPHESQALADPLGAAADAVARVNVRPALPLQGHAAEKADDGSSGAQRLSSVLKRPSSPPEPAPIDEGADGVFQPPDF